MEEYVQVSTTTGARHDAQRIATELVERRLAGCVQITGPVESVYRWKDQIESTEEWLCLAKTTVEQLTAIDALITELHPYETPELIVTPIIGGSEAYLQWLASELGDTQ